MKDFLGQEMQIGDIVVHGQRSGNSGSLEIKLVLDMRESDYYGHKREEVKVIGCSKRDMKWDPVKREWYDIDPEFTMNSRGGWTTPDVLMVVNDSVPSDIYTFLQMYKKTLSK